MLRPIPRRRALSRRLFNVRVDSVNGPPWPGMGTPIAHARLMTGISARRIAGWSIGFSTDEIWIWSTLQIISNFAPRGNDDRRSLDTALCSRTTGDTEPAKGAVKPCRSGAAPDREAGESSVALADRQAADCPG